MCFTSQKTVKYFFLFSFNCTREKRDTHEEITWHTQNFPSPTKSCSHKVHKTSTKTESEVGRVREFKYICIEILCFIALTLKKEHKWFCVCFASIIYDTSNIDDDYYYDSASLSLFLSFNIIKTNGMFRSFSRNFCLCLIEKLCTLAYYHFSYIVHT